MRIIAGSLKGRRIESPRGSSTRPTTDRIREALMSSLMSANNNRFEGIHVLDAFAGTGALGLESISRGAHSCTFCETDPKALETLKKNISSLNLSSSCLLLKQDVFKHAKAGLFTQAPFHLVFLDPPYIFDSLSIQELIKDLITHKKLASGALIVYEFHVDNFDFNRSGLGENLSLVVQKKYGITGLVVCRYFEASTLSGKQL